MKNRTLFFGEGLFETFRVYLGRKLAFVKDHLDRMREGCEFFDLPFSQDEAEDTLRKTLEEIPKDLEARLRLNLMSYGDHDKEIARFETAWEPLRGLPDNEGSGVPLTLAPFQRFSRSPLVRFKTTSYLENISVFSKARKEGFFDALFTNERGEITEGCITNIFFTTENEIVTPPVDAGLLPGVIRKQVVDMAQQLGIPLKKAPLSVETLGHYQGAFVTNSVIEILPVRGIGSATFKRPGLMNPLLKEYRKRLEESFVTLTE